LNMKKLGLILSICLAATLAACGSGDDDVAQVAAADTVMAANVQTANAAAGTTFTFPGGVSTLGTTATTTFAFTNTATTPAFSINSGGQTAAGTTNFGSCIFAITQSTFAAPHPLSVGQTVTTNPCNLVAGTKGLVAGGPAANRGLALVLGAAQSNGTEVPMSVGAGGQLTINSKEVGTITIVAVSGGSS